MDTFHDQLRKSLSWYNNWHNHPRHHHTHWMLFVIISILTTSFVSRDIKDFYYENEYTAEAQTITIIGISGDKFTINGQQTFLLSASYFDGLGESDANIQSDFDRFSNNGFNAVRVLVNWPCETCPYSNTSHRLSSNYTSTLNTTIRDKLRRLIDFASDRGMIVDVTFHDRGLFSSFSSYRDFVLNATSALPSSTYRNVIFDLQNEANDSGTTFLSDSERRAIRDAVKSTDPGRLVTISTAGGTGGEADFVVDYNLDFMAGHDLRTPSTGTWYDNTDNYVNTARSSMGTTAPIYLQEPNRYDSGDTQSQWITAARNAKCAGAAGWTLHSSAGYDLVNDAFSDLVSSTFLSQVSGAVTSTTWGSCSSGGGGSTPTPPPSGGGGGPVPGVVYTGESFGCPAGYITLTRARATTDDPTETAGWFCDDEASFPTTNTYPPVGNEIYGLTYPITGAFLACTDANNGTAFYTSSNWWPCNTGRTGNPGWTFVNGTPHDTNADGTLGNPVQFRETLNCANEDRSNTFTINDDNFIVGGYTNAGNPSTRGEICIPGEVVTSTPTPGNPTITSITPNSAREGDTVIITGTNLDQCEPITVGGGVPSPLCNVSFFDPAGNRNTVSGTTTSPTSVTAVVANGLCSGEGTVQVSLPGTPSNNLPFTVINGTGVDCFPVSRFIYYIYPDRAPPGAPITIAGENLSSTVHFYDSAGTDTVTTGIISGVLNGIDVYVDLIVPDELTPGSYTVRVGGSNDLSNPFPFTITTGTHIPNPIPANPPVITSLNPQTISQGGTLEIHGDNLPATVSFTDSSGQVTVVLGWVNGDFNILTVGIPANFLPGQYTVSVTGPNGSASSPEVLTVTEGDVSVSAQSTGIVIPQSTTAFGTLIGSSLNYAVYALGIAVFMMILYAGFLWMTSAANPGNIALAKRYMTNAVLGAILLLSSYIILYTINPDLVGGSLELPGISPQPTTTAPPTTSTPPSSACSNPQTLAQQYNEYYPQPRPGTNYGGAPELDTLINCIVGSVNSGVGSIFTYEQTNTLCNYTRGNQTCGSCAHAVNSCHYGGLTGNQGSLAVDFGNEDIGDQIIQAAITCGAKTTSPGDPRCESSSGQRVACSDPSATHVHVNTASCDRN